MSLRIGSLFAAGFAATVILANWATSRFGLIPVGFGYEATGGAYFAGLAFILRDAVQDALGRRWVGGALIAGAIVSYAVSSPALAIASAVAFMVSESADMAVYTPLRASGYLRAALVSNTVGAAIDTLVFLGLAGFPVWASFPGQMIGKTASTGVIALGVVMARALLRQPLR